MKKKNIPKPTEAEMVILDILWDQGPSTAREVQHKTNRAKNTVLTLLQIMERKGLVTRDDSSYAHVYHAKYSQEDVQQTVLQDVVGKVFKGSTYSLVLKALSLKTLSEDELDEIHNILEKKRK